MAEYKLSYTANEIDEKLKRIKDGGVGYSEPGKVLTWDGDTSNEVEFGGGTFGVRIADYIDLTEVESVTVEVNGIETITIQKSQLTSVVQSPVEGLFIGNLSADGVNLLITVSAEFEGLEAGTYTVTRSFVRFISATLADTIHPIDTKYIPDTIARVADLPNIGGSGSPISEEELLELLVEMDVVQPISNASNALYTDENNIVYVL